MKSLISVLAVGLLLGGCSRQGLSSPSAIGGASGGTLSSSAGSDTTTVHRFSNGSVVPGASSTLIRTENGVSMTLQTSELQASAAYSVWWIVFNHPSQCGSHPCGESDLGNAAVAPLVTHAAGHVIGPNGTGNFAGSLREGAVVDNLLGEFGGPSSGSLIDAQEAEIHFVVRTHGDKNTPGGVPDQIHTFEVLCDPSVCRDVQFAIHQP